MTVRESPESPTRQLVEAERRIQELESRLAAAEETIQSLTYQAQVLEHVHDAVVGIDLDFTITYWNAAATAVYGWPAEMALGRNLKDVLFCGLTSGQLLDAIRTLRSPAADQAGPLHFKLHQRGMHGRELDIEAAVMAMRGPGGQVSGFVAAVHDVTQQEALLSSIRKSEADFRAIFDLASVGLYEFDLQTQRFTRANRKFCELVGYSEAELQGISFIDILPPEDRADALNFYRASLTSGADDWLIEGRYLRKDGSEVWVHLAGTIRRDPAGQPVRTYAVAQDLTARDLLQKELAAQKALFDAVLDQLPVGVSIAEAPSGRGLYHNREAERLLGHSMIAGDSIARYTGYRAVHPDGRPYAPEEYPTARSVLTGEVIHEGELRYVHGEGGERLFSVSATPVVDAQGRRIAAVSIFYDISERKRISEALAEYARQLERSNQELQEFAYVASHDLQEPLRKVKAFSAALQQRLAGKLTAEDADQFTRMGNAVARMQEMIADLLELSRVTSQGQPFRPVNLRNTLEEVVSDLEVGLAKTGGRVEVGPLPVVEADPVQMQRLFLNLVGNGLKYHQEGAPPLVKVWGQSRPAKDRHLAYVYVEDNGIGFDEQYLERIFQPFQRLHGRSRYEGTGMGLAICKKIVERHGGAITAHSEPGKGSTFIVTFPLKKG